MPSLKHKIIECRYFFSVAILLLIIAAVISFSFNKADLFLALTPWHSKPADYFFVIVTQLGNGLFAIALAILLAIKKQYQAAVVLLLSFAISGLASQLIKSLVTELRPYPYFQTLGIALPIVDGETATAGSNSFPSGHTATIFSIISSSVMMLPHVKKSWPWFLLLTILVAYSRLYVSNHFLIDLAGGALLGLLAAILAYAIVYRYGKRKELGKGYREA